LVGWTFVEEGKLLHSPQVAFRGKLGQISSWSSSSIIFRRRVTRNLLVTHSISRHQIAAVYAHASRPPPLAASFNAVSGHADKRDVR